MKKSLCIGVNTGKLEGCEYDAQNWHNLFQSNQFQFDSSQLILTKNASKNNVMSEIRKLTEELNEEDLGVIFFSGHGKDVNDKQAIVCEDDDLYDWELRGLLSPKNEVKGKIVFISDSCHSGDLTNLGANVKARILALQMMGSNLKWNINQSFSIQKIHHILSLLSGKQLQKFNNILQEAYEQEIESASRIKYMYPTSAVEYINNCLNKKRSFIETEKKDILISACSKLKKTEEVKINGQWQGIFSHYAIEIIKQKISNTNYSYLHLHHDLLTNIYLKNQQPEIQGIQQLKQRIIFNN